jgi:hypothetical protein
MVAVQDKLVLIVVQLVQLVELILHLMETQEKVVVVVETQTGRGTLVVTAVQVLLQQLQQTCQAEQAGQSLVL